MPFEFVCSRCRSTVLVLNWPTTHIESEIQKLKKARTLRCPHCNAELSYDIIDVQVESY